MYLPQLLPELSLVEDFVISLLPLHPVQPLLVFVSGAHPLVLTRQFSLLLEEIRHFAFLLRFIGLYFNLGM